MNSAHQKLVDVLARLRDFIEPVERRDFVAGAVRHLSRADQFVTSLRYGGSPSQFARQLVVHAHNADEGFLAAIIAAARDEATSAPDLQALDEAFRAVHRPRATTWSDSEVAALDRVREKQIAEWRAEPHRRHERFIPLNLVPRGEEWRTKKRVFRSLPALMEQVQQPVVPVVGAPGAGKTTLLQQLTFAVAKENLRTTSRRVAFFLPLNEYPRRAAPGFGPWFEQRIGNTDPDLPSLTRLLASGDVWLLLDGINEMAYGESPNDRFSDLRDWLEGLPPNNRVVVTCREQDMTGSLGALQRFEVMPLSRDAMRDFLFKHVAEKAEVAWDDLQRQNLVELYQSPYLLRILADELLETGEIPPNRAALFSSMVRRAVVRNLEVKSLELHTLMTPRTLETLRQGELPRPYAPDLVQGDLLIAVSRLAFQWNCEGPGQRNWWPLQDALEILNPRNAVRAEALLRAARSILVLEERTAAGEVRFTHAQLQEYFAARHWVFTSEDRAFQQAQKAERVDDPKFVEPLIDIVERLQPTEHLPPRPATGWEETAIISVSLTSEADPGFVARLAHADLVTTARAALKYDSPVPQPTKDDLRERLGAYVQDPNVELRARIAAGMVLDDPTVVGFEVHRSEGAECLLPPTIVLPAGEYLVGSFSDDFRAFDDETPKYFCSVERDLEVSQYPVTNAEYQLFIASGGYENERWWPEGESRTWWKGERPDTQAEHRARELHSWSADYFRDIMNRHGSPKEVRDELEFLRSRPLEEVIEALRPSKHAANMKRPHFWRDEAYNRLLQPVVGVCAFEAEAFTRWLSDICGRRVRLLSESEWEAAARGYGRSIWSYGDSPNILAANTFEVRLGRPSPVGVFLDGATADGLMDMSGNVWEWTSSVWSPDHSGPAPGEIRRVAKGGSWTGPIEYSRAACRGRKPVDFRHHDIGFRVCLDTLEPSRDLPLDTESS